MAWRGSALTRLEAGIALVDDVNAPLAADDAAVLVALLQRFEGIGDLHLETLPRAKGRTLENHATAVNLPVASDTDSAILSAAAVSH